LCKKKKFAPQLSTGDSESSEDTVFTPTTTAQTFIRKFHLYESQNLIAVFDRYQNCPALIKLLTRGRAKEVVRKFFYKFNLKLSSFKKTFILVTEQV
jgi:hypothetical protein